MLDVDGPCGLVYRLCFQYEIGAFDFLLAEQGNLNILVVLDIEVVAKFLNKSNVLLPILFSSTATTSYLY